MDMQTKYAEILALLVEMQITSDLGNYPITWSMYQPAELLWCTVQLQASLRDFILPKNCLQKIILSAELVQWKTINIHSLHFTVYALALNAVIPEIRLN